MMNEILVLINALYEGWSWSSDLCFEAWSRDILRNILDNIQKNYVLP